MMNRLRPRSIHWLLAALLALATTVCVPASSFAPLRVTHAIVRVDRARETQSATREIRSFPRRESPAVTPLRAVPALSPLLDHSLFQRPPPVSIR
jgi:hypothetical protein